MPYHTTMTRLSASVVPAESDWLCEGCGYILTALPGVINCPECGQPVSQSVASLRRPAPWERSEDGSALRRFLLTTAQVLFIPSRFYRSLATRDSRIDSLRFARIHWILASVLFGTAAWLHFNWLFDLGSGVEQRYSAMAYGIRFSLFDLGLTFVVPFSLLSFALLLLTTRLAAYLTSWEANYRGIRLPHQVVLRGLDYHAAHYLPVALLALSTVLAFRIILWRDPTLAIQLAVPYLFVLCGEVVLSAIYLFETYWTAMRRMMYASR